MDSLTVASDRTMWGTLWLAVYDDISIALFVIGYMQVMEGEKPADRTLVAKHIQELKGDAELYGW